MRPAFAVWVTGLPASGKSTVTRALSGELASRGVDVAVLESDALRRVLTPHPSYTEDERASFYGAIAYIGSLLVQHGVPVVFDATANRRAYREAGRRAIDRFLEVYVECPLDVCVARDPKGLYARARSGDLSTVPGVQAAYEPPEHPDLIVSGTREASAAARAIVSMLEEKGYLARTEKTRAMQDSLCVLEESDSEGSP
jgi:adenylylsulfate kinase